MKNCVFSNTWPYQKMWKPYSQNFMRKFPYSASEMVTERHRGRRQRLCACLGSFHVIVIERRAKGPTIKSWITWLIHDNIRSWCRKQPKWTAASNSRDKQRRKRAAEVDPSSTWSTFFCPRMTCYFRTYGRQRQHIILKQVKGLNYIF